MEKKIVLFLKKIPASKNNYYTNKEKQKKPHRHIHIKKEDMRDGYKSPKKVHSNLRNLEARNLGNTGGKENLPSINMSGRDNSGMILCLWNQINVNILKAFSIARKI